MENDLDKIASGEIFWKDLLKKFWKDFESKAKEVSSYKTSDVIEKINSDMLKYVLSKEKNNNDEINDSCPKCFETLKGKIKIKFSKYGYFLGCEKYPECDFIKPLQSVFLKNSENLIDQNSENTEDSLKEYLLSDISPIFEDGEVRIIEKNGRFGKYLEVFNKKTDEKKNITFPENFMKTWTGPKEELIKNLSKLPLKIGTHPDSGEEIYLEFGRFGFYVSCNKILASIKSINPFEIKVNTAVNFLKESIEKQKRNSKEINLGNEIGDVKIIRGGFGKISIVLTKSIFNFKGEDGNFFEISVPEEKQKILTPKNLVDFNEPNIEEIKEFIYNTILKFKKKTTRNIKKK
jgi:DNA topoisomerase-1